MSHPNPLIPNTQTKRQLVFSPSPLINVASRFSSCTTPAQIGHEGLLAGSQVANMSPFPNSSVNNVSLSPLDRKHPLTTPPSMGFNFMPSGAPLSAPIGPAGFLQQPGTTTFSLTQSWPNGPRMPSSFEPAVNPYHTQQTIAKNFPNHPSYSNFPGVVPTPGIYGQPPYSTINSHAVIANTYNALGIKRNMSVYGHPSLPLDEERTPVFNGKPDSQMVLKSTHILSHAEEEMGTGERAKESGTAVKEDSRMTVKEESVAAVKEKSVAAVKEGGTGVKEGSNTALGKEAIVTAIKKRKLNSDTQESGAAMKKMKSIRVSRHHRTNPVGNISGDLSEFLTDSNSEIEFPINIASFSSSTLTDDETSNHDVTGDLDAFSNTQTYAHSSSPPEDTASFKESHPNGDSSNVLFPHAPESISVCKDTSDIPQEKDASFVCSNESLYQDLNTSFSFLNSPNKIVLELEISSETPLKTNLHGISTSSHIDAPLPMTSETNSVDLISHEEHTSPFGTSESSITSSSSSSRSSLSSEDEVIHPASSTLLDDYGGNDKNQAKERKEMNLKLAISAVKKGELSVNKAADRFDVPETTLRRQLKNPTTEKAGRKHLLTKEEEASVVDALIFMGEMGLGFGRKNLHWIVGQVLKEKGIKAKASRSWMDKFIARYNHLLVMRTPEIYSKNRAVAGNQEDHDLLFNQLENIYDLHNYHNRPEAIVNFDEKPHGSNVGQEKILMAKGTKDAKRLSNDNAKMKTSVLHTCVANGTMLAPVVIYRAKNVTRAWTEGGPEGALYAANDTGNMTKELCVQYFEQVLVPYRIKIGGRLLAYADGFRGHLSYQIIKLCVKYGIDLWIWPSHTSDTYQMCDKGLFAPAQAYWEKTIIPEHLHSTGFSNISKVDFPVLLGKLYSSSVFSKKNVVNSFRGFNPLDRDFVKKEVFAKTQLFNNVPLIPKEVDIFVNPNRMLVDPVTGILTSEQNINESGDVELKNTSFSRKMVCSNINEILRSLLCNEQESVCVPWALPWDLLDLLTVWSYHMAKSESLKKVLSLSDLTKFRTLANAFQALANADNEDGLLILALDLFKTLRNKVSSNLKNTLDNDIHILEETLKYRGVDDGYWDSEENRVQTVDGLEEDCDRSRLVPDNNVQSTEEYSDRSPPNVLSSPTFTEKKINSPSIRTEVGKNLSANLSEQSKKKNSQHLQSEVESMESESFVENVYGSNVLEGLRKLSHDPSKQSSETPSRTSKVEDVTIEKTDSIIKSNYEELEQMNSLTRMDFDFDSDSDSDSVKLSEVGDGSNSQTTESLQKLTVGDDINKMGHILDTTASHLTSGRGGMDQASTNSNRGTSDPAAYKEVSDSGGIQMINFVECPCQLKVIDSGMLFCKQCGTLQHNICFRIANGQLIESHACLDCSERHDIKCTDYNLREVGDKELIRMTCLYRRVVNALNELSTVTLEILAHSSKIDDMKVLKTFWLRLLNAGAIRHDSFGEHFIVDKNVLQSKLTPQTFGFNFARKKGIVPEADNSVNETVSISSSRGTVEIPSVKKALLETIQKQFQRAPIRKPVGKKMLFKTEGNFLATSEMIDKRFTQQEEKEKEEKATKEKKKEASLINKKAKELEKEQKIYEKKKRIEEKENERKAKLEEKEREKRAKEEEKKKKQLSKEEEKGKKVQRKKKCARANNTPK